MPEVLQKRIQDISGRNRPDRRQQVLGQQHPHASERQERKNRGERGRGAENDEYADRGRLSDRAQISDQSEVNEHHGGERQAEVARACPHGQERGAEQRCQRAADIGKKKVRKGDPAGRPKRQRHAIVHARHGQSAQGRCESDNKGCRDPNE